MFAKGTYSSICPRKEHSKSESTQDWSSYDAENAQSCLKLKLKTKNYVLVSLTKGS
jgi:hypothetical protein